MKVIYAFFLMCFLSILTNGQVQAGPPDLAVVKHGWLWVVRPGLPSIDDDPMLVNDESQQATRDRKINMRENKVRTQEGRSVEAPPTRSTARRMDRPNAPTGLYVYEMKVKNSGPRSIKTLSWDYVFYEPGTKKEVGRRRFVTEVKLAPGKTRSVAERSVSPPTGTFTAAQSGKKPGALYDGVIVIKSVEYEDGSTWQSGSD